MCGKKKIRIMYVYFISFELILVCTVRERSAEYLANGNWEPVFPAGSGVKSTERAAGELPRRACRPAPGKLRTEFRAESLADSDKNRRGKLEW
jgi:hypothetical protein